jgi:hypothetical protein
MHRFILLLLFGLSVWLCAAEKRASTDAPLLDFIASYTSFDEDSSSSNNTTKANFTHNVRCSRVASAGKSESALTCLPSLIIAGTQKSGTTALAALLSLHPYLSFAPKKEVHFFDKYDNYKQGIHQYVSSFRPWTGNYSHNETATASAPTVLPPNTIPLFAEATPFCKPFLHALYHSMLHSAPFCSILLSTAPYYFMLLHSTSYCSTLLPIPPFLRSAFSCTSYCISLHLLHSFAPYCSILFSSMRSAELSSRVAGSGHRRCGGQC